MKRWITADWHLGEDRFEIMGRPFKTQMENIETLIKNHNELVQHDDWVIMVGDVCYQKYPEYLPYVEKFNGKKTLLRGNHDRVFTDEQLSKYFSVIIPEGEGIVIYINEKPFYVTHYPTEGKLDTFNLVGHVHSAWKFQLNMLNVGVDVNHFRPFDVETVSAHVDAITKYYDDDVWVAYQKINEQYRGIRGKKGTYFKS
jgi:calcineurin-like phosphoesterase family protein